MVDLPNLQEIVNFHFDLRNFQDFGANFLPNLRIVVGLFSIADPSLTVNITGFNKLERVGILDIWVWCTK